MSKIIAIPLLVSIFFIIISLIIVNVQMKTFPKLFIMIGMSLIGFIIWNVWPSFMGYATLEELPDEWVLIWFNIVKPNYIEILMEPYDPSKEKRGILSYKKDYMEKRFYRCAYDEQLDNGLSDNAEKAAKGVKIVFRKTVTKNSGGSGMGSGSRGRAEFVPHEDLPPGRLPIK